MPLSSPVAPSEPVASADAARAVPVHVTDAVWFWDVLRRYLPLYGHVAMASFVVNLLSLSMPLFIMNVYDRVVPNQAFESLWVLAAGVCLAFTMDFVLRNARTYFVDLAGRNADVILLGRFMDVLLDRRFDGQVRSVGAMVAEVREFEHLREFFASTTLLTLIDAPFVILFLAIMYLLGGWLVLVPLMALPCMIGFSLLIQIPFRRSAEIQMRHSLQKNGLLVEIATSLETIKAAQMQPALSRRWDRVVDQGAQSTVEARRLGAMAANTVLFINMLLSALVVIVGVYLIAAGSMTMGGLIACVILMGRVMAPLTQLASLFSQLQKSRLALKSLHRFMLSPLENPVAEPSTAGDDSSSRLRVDENGETLKTDTDVEAPEDRVRHPAHDVAASSILRADLRADHVFFRYPGQDRHQWALHDVTLRIRHGEKVGVVGGTGSGKSTLARLCLGLYEPVQGDMLLGDVDMRRLAMRTVRRNIGFLPQEVCLFSGTLRDNLMMAWPEPPAEEELLRVAELAGVLDFARLHPLGLDMPLGERGGGLSGGQAQSVALARALARQPGILILDEPTSNLDEAAEKRLRDRLRPTLKDRTFIVLTHRLSMLELVDRVLVLDQGRLVQDGPVARLVKTS